MKEKLNNPAVGLLLFRFGLAAVFIIHGWAKFSDLTGTANFFASIGLPEFLVWPVAAIELLAGVALLFGFLTRLAGLLLAVVMVGAIISVKFRLGFSGGYEFDLVLLLSALGLVFTGPGRYSLKP